MNRKQVLGWWVFFLAWLFLIGSFFFTPLCHAQYLISADIVTSFKRTMQNDNLVFPDSVIYQLVNIATGIACIHGFADPKIDSIVLATGTDQYGLKFPAIWVYRIGKLGATQRSWSRIDLGDFGKYSTKDVLYPAFWDFTHQLETGADSITGTGIDTSYIWIYPKPTTADSGDTIEVNYFAYEDSLKSNLKPNYRDVVLSLTLMLGYFRAGRSDNAVSEWNKASSALSVLRNEMLGKIYNIEIVPKTLGGK